MGGRGGGACRGEGQGQETEDRRDMTGVSWRRHERHDRCQLTVVLVGQAQQTVVLVGRARQSLVFSWVLLILNSQALR